MVPPPYPHVTPTSHHEAIAQFQTRLAALLSTGEYTPFVYPYRAFGPNLLICYLLLPPTQSKIVYHARYPLFALITYLSVSAIIECRSSMVTVGYGIGLLNAWAVLWSACLITFNDARGEFQRIEEQPCDEQGQADGVIKGISTGAEGSKYDSLRPRPVNGHINPVTDRKVDESTSSVCTTFNFQPLPEAFYHRIDWVFDLVSNFRGLRWTYQITGLAPPPPHIHASLADPSFPSPTPDSHLTRTDLLRRDLPNFLLSCLALDILKTITLRDPYFWGLPPSMPSPFPYPLASRLLISITFVYTSLLTIFLLAPLVFGVLLGPRYIGQHAWPWLYPPYFGSLKQVWQKGIPGFWGGWWHQLFRYAFEQAGEFVAGIVDWEKKSQPGMALRVLVAFACSGILHACASYTTLGDTRPIGGAFAFFMLQPVGIFGQRAATGWIRRIGLREGIPSWIMNVGNMVIVFAWCFLTGPNIANDFAATGIWLYEPLPISPFRGLRGEGWWQWRGNWVTWHAADRWWQSGLAF